MTRIAVGLVLLAFVVAPAADAQPGVDARSMSHAQRLYESHCALCHESSGDGDPSTFPALRGNDRLEDLARLVSGIRLGSARMPAFPNLTTEEVALLANYVRTAWANAYGSVSTEDVSALLDRL